MAALAALGLWQQAADTLDGNDHINNQNRKGALYQIAALILARLSTLTLVRFTTFVLVKLAILTLVELAALVFRRTESGLRYNSEIGLFG